MNRNREIIHTSNVGIGANILLAAFKFTIGAAANSVSIRADAINNATDALSSLITIIGTKLSEREPDRKHPFGYGRVEYLASLLIGMIILYAGVMSLISSIRRILAPEPNEYTVWTMTVMTAAILVKTAVGFYTKKQGRKLASAALSASGQDALNDAGATAAALGAAVVYVSAGVSVEAYVAFLISFLILKTGFETLRETISSLLGERVDLSLAADVRKAILSFPEVDDVFGLAIHNYGVGKLIGSAHVEVPESLTAAWIDNLQRAVSEKVLADTGVRMMGLTIYAVNSHDQEAAAMRERITQIAQESGSIRAVHGFYFDKVDRVISFEAEIDFETHGAAELREQLVQRIHQEYPDCSVHLQISRSIED